MQKGKADLIKQLQDLKQPFLECQIHQGAPVTHIRIGNQSKRNEKLLEPVCFLCFQNEQIEKTSIIEFKNQLIEKIKNFKFQQSEQGAQLQESLNMTKELFDLFTSLATQMKNEQEKIKEQMQKFEDPEAYLWKAGEEAVKIFNSQNAQEFYTNWKKLIPFMDSTSKSIQLSSPNGLKKSQKLSEFNEQLIQLQKKLNKFQLECKFTLEQPDTSIQQQQYPTNLEYLMNNYQQMYFVSKNELKSWNYDFLILEIQYLKKQLRLDCELYFECKFSDKDQFVNSGYNMMSLKYEFKYKKYKEYYYGYGEYEEWLEEKKYYLLLEEKWKQTIKKFNDSQEKFRKTIQIVYERSKTKW